MSDDGDDAPPGAPMWMATFADLMSLLMCFFVLILSFSEMDVMKYKQIADSMRDAFGVQRQLKLQDIPKGTSVIATHFSPGKPDPTITETIQQETVNQDQKTLKTGNPDADESDAEDIKDLIEQRLENLAEETEDDAEMLRELLREEIENGQIDVLSEGRTIVIRIREKGSFPSGSAILDVSFSQVLTTTGDALDQIDGRISIEGHTDNIPINTARYGSNWDLSAARAVAVTEQVLEGTSLSPDRVTVSGFADTRPQAPNSSWEGRAQNRRVEIVVKQPISESDDALFKQVQKTNPEVIDVLDVNSLTE